MKVYENDKIQLQTPTKKLTRLYILKLNVTIGMHFFFFFFFFNMHAKFRSNRIIFTIRSINLFYIHDLRLYKLEIKYLIDDMAIDFLFS